MIWHSENLKRLTDLWAEGLPAKQIGNIMGVSKNAIIGKARRMGLEPRKETRLPMIFSRNPKEKQPPTIPPPIAVGSSGVAFMDIKAGECRSVMGRDDGGLVRFCGLPTGEGESFCAGHRKIYYYTRLS